MVHSCNLHTWEAEAGLPQVQGQSELYSEFQWLHSEAYETLNKQKTWKAEDILSVNEGRFLNLLSLIFCLNFFSITILIIASLLYFQLENQMVGINLKFLWILDQIPFPFLPSVVKFYMHNPALKRLKEKLKVQG